MDGDTGTVQADQHGLRLDALHAEAHEVGEPVLLARPGPTTSTPSTASAASTTRGDLAPGGRRLGLDGVVRLAGQRGGRGAEGEERRDGLEPGPATALLLAADEQRFEPAAAPHDQRAGARHASELVRTDADQVGVRARRGRSARGRRRPRRRRAP